MNVERELEKLQGASYSLSRDPHVLCYLTADEYLLEVMGDKRHPDRDRMVQSGRIWRLIVFTDTQAGHHRYYSDTLEGVLEKAVRMEDA